jgi:hypothetical protein
MFVPLYSFTLTEHDPAKPWLVLSIEQRTVELDESEDFGRWARAQWPAAAFTIDLDPRLDAWPPQSTDI